MRVGITDMDLLAKLLAQFKLKIKSTYSKVDPKLGTSISDL